MTTDEKRELSMTQLRHLIAEGSTIYSMKRSTSSNGLTKWYDFYVIFQPATSTPYLAYLSGHIANVLPVTRTVHGIKLVSTDPAELVDRLQDLTGIKLFHESI